MRGFESHLLRLKIKYAGMVESADTADSKSAEAIRKGSSPFTSTNYGGVLKRLKRLDWKSGRSKPTLWCVGSNPTPSALSGCSSAWLERLIWDQEAAGSNPVIPTCNISQNIVQLIYILGDVKVSTGYGS